MGRPQTLHAIRHSLFQRGDEAPLHCAERQVPHKQRPRCDVFKAIVA
jgi:hypothetical protein